MITWAVTVCNEHNELRRLLNLLVENIVPEDEILIQCDEDNVTELVENVISEFELSSVRIRVIYFPLAEDFSKFKNNIFDHAAEPWIFQIDADEYPSQELLKNVHELITKNLDTECFELSRVNIVNGITLDHIIKWGWLISSNALYTNTVQLSDISESLKQILIKFNLITRTDDGIITYQIPLINFPDHQMRIYRNIPRLRWVNKVHEKLSGVITSAKITDHLWSLIHIKDIYRQESQNDFYSTLI